MGNNKPVERKRKKKGRPSLLDLQKRSLRLQNKADANPNPNSNPYIRFPNASPARRPIGRRFPNPDSIVTSSAAVEEEDDDDDDSLNGRRKEKKLKLVLRIPNSGSDSEGGESDREKGGERNNSSKGTDAIQGGASDLGPTTPLPDKKLLVFILDRLQKKDTYGVYSEPVDANELPDYHQIVRQPMDFGTVRKKLSNGEYANLEQFETDVYLISSNAMKYNSPDTIYYRQARAIHELAKKNFENLRQESDDDEPEPEPKPVARRGRPPKKKLADGSPAPNRAGLDFSNNSILASGGDGTVLSNVSGKPYNLRQTERFSWANMHKLELNEEYSGYGLKGSTSKYGKKFSVIDEDRRSTYKQPQTSTCDAQPSMFSALEGEQKQLLPIGLHYEHSYARSLARFAANLGPVGWAIAAKKIEQVLPPGTKFGPGWVGDPSEAPKHSQPPPPSAIPQLPFSELNNFSQKLEPPPNDFANAQVHFRRAFSIPTTSTRSPETSPDVVSVESSRGLNYDERLNPGIQPPFGAYHAFGFNFPSQVGKTVRSSTRPPVPLMHHARSLEKDQLVSSSTVHPDLNVMFQSSGSPASAIVVDSHQPDLALQL